MYSFRPLLFAILGFAAFCMACQPAQISDTPPDNLIRKDKFQAVLVDVFLADAHVQEMPLSQDSQKMELNKAYAQIFDHHKVTKKTYMETLAWYNMHPGEFFQVMEPVKDTLSALEAQRMK
jgi:hypothetical protein